MVQAELSVAVALIGRLRQPVLRHSLSLYHLFPLEVQLSVRGICELLRLIILLDTNILKTDCAASDAFRLTDDGVLDRPKLFHLRKRRTYSLPLGIKILDRKSVV